MMAAYIGHVLSTESIKLLSNSTKTVTVICTRGAQNHLKIKKSPKRFFGKEQIKSKATSLASRGFLRNIHPFTPPEDASNKLMIIFKNITGSADMKKKLNIEIKFNLLSVLSKEFSYSVPNSLLYKMKTLEDVFKFYSTPVENVVPYDKFKEIDLPPNLHILYDHHRFHPDTDTKFNGISAFPKSSTIVCGLTTKKKYKGFKAESPWEDI